MRRCTALVVMLAATKLIHSLSPASRLRGPQTATAQEAEEMTTTVFRAISTISPKVVCRSSALVASWVRT